MNTRDEFLAARRRGVGGSDMAVILGISPFSTRLELYLEKRGEIPPRPDTSMKVWLSPASTSDADKVPTVAAGALFSARVAILSAMAVGTSFTSVRFTVTVCTDEVFTPSETVSPSMKLVCVS